MRVDGHDVRDLTLPSLRHHIGMVLDEPFLFSVSIRDNIAYGRPDASFDDVDRGGASPPAPTSSSASCPTATTPWSASAASRSPVASASGSSIARTLLREPADPRARRRDVGDRRADRAADPRRARAADGRPHDADHRPPPLDDQPGRPRRGGRGRARHRRGHARRAAGDRAALRRDPRPDRRSDARRPSTRRRVAHDAGDDRTHEVDVDVAESRRLDADVGIDVSTADLDDDRREVD